MRIADLHIHSKYSRATSADCDAPHLELWARRKGISIVGTGDFTHPQWRKELRESLLPAEEGLYTLRPELRLPDSTQGASEAPRFVVTGEISSIYKRDGKTRKVHSLILLPGLDAADALAAKLEQIGNIHSDGRPILGLDARDLLEITLDTCPDAVFIPAHIWTPHFSLFGAFSGFDTIEECFGDLTAHIHALETGLSSDPPMNWRVSALDRYTLVSHSDAHSPAKLGREADLVDIPLSYPALKHALDTGEGFAGTLEFFPEEGKYHLDGHRACELRLEPEQTLEYGGKCPICGKKLTIGVQHRALELADRAAGYKPASAKPFTSIVPLPELLASANGTSATNRATVALYETLLRELGQEFTILRETPLPDIERVAGFFAAEGIKRLREGRVTRIAGYDGEFGKILLFDPAEREKLRGQLTLFGQDAPKPTLRKKAASLPKEAPQTSAEAIHAPAALNPEQLSAATATERAIAVIAGPGTGKTKTLVERVLHLLREGAKPATITAVTFTNQAAKELRQRIEAAMGGAKAVKGMTIGTFHAICVGLLPPKPLLGQEDALALLREMRGGLDAKAARALLEKISQQKSGVPGEYTQADQALLAAYTARCEALGVRDLDDLLLQALAQPLDKKAEARFTHLLVDEVQDIDPIQRELLLHWGEKSQSLFVIGDPDQSIYGFRGASAACFAQLQAALPQMRTIALKSNYRSTPQILAAASAVIAHNPGDERALAPTLPSGAPVRLHTFASPFAEGIFLAKEITRMTGGMDMLSAQRAGAKERGELHAFSEIAVLCRTRRQLELIENCLRHDDIPCVVVGRDKTLQDDAPRGALAFFRLLLTPADTAALRTCLRLTWGCTTTTAERIAQAAQNAADASALAQALQQTDCPPQLLADIAAFAPLLRKEKPAKLLTSWAKLHGDIEAMHALIATAQFHDTMDALLTAVTLGEEADLRRASGKVYASGAVTLMTLHGAKGLEFPIVFLCGLTKGQLPLEREDDDVDTEEERRLFFVGITRAREQLILTAAEPLSPFAAELPDAVLTNAEHAKPQPQTKQLTLF